MRMIGCNLHRAQQTIAILDCETGERIERTLKHEGSVVRDFYASVAAPVVVGIEATGSMGCSRTTASRRSGCRPPSSLMGAPS